MFLNAYTFICMTYLYFSLMLFTQKARLNDWMINAKGTLL